MDSALLVHRLHFAFTITFHYLFPQLTMGLAGCYRYSCDQGTLPKILVVDFGYRDVEFVAQPVLQALHYMPLLF